MNGLPRRRSNEIRKVAQHMGAMPRGILKTNNLQGGKE